MKVHIAVVTMGRQDLIDRLFSELFWRSTHDFVSSIVVLSQVEPISISHSRDTHKIYTMRTNQNVGCSGARQMMTAHLMIEGLGREDIIVFLDDDVEIVSGDWLVNLCYPLLDEYSISGIAGRRVTEDYLTEVTPDLHPDYVSGGWCAIRGDVFLDGCMFDERFFPNYWEDVDLCYQARAKGKKIISVGNVGLKHEHPPTDEAAQHVSVNRKRFIEKWSNL